VDTVSSLYKGSVADDGAESDKSGLAFLLLRLSEGIGNGAEVGVTIVDVENLPTVGEEPLFNIFSERECSVTINGDI
jgi:hypothetical protein